MQKPHLYSGGRYPVLRSLGILYLVAGGLILLAGLVTAGWALMRAPGYASDRVVLAITALVGTFFLVLTMLAVAELIKLFIDLEHNTRMAAGRMIDSTYGSGAPGANADTSQVGGRMRHMEEESAEAALLRGH